MPDIGGETVLVKQGGKLLMSGSWPLVHSQESFSE
jgi:hypothetical protein